MSVHVKYFASLREEIGRAEDSVSISGTATVEEIWHQTTGNLQRDSLVLVAVNQEYADFDHIVQDGDEVAFFPPVTGG
ncbi:MAG: molybdopterin converting factor subunit 1 [Gammaproteobacteria bacterium]|nr:molybdopterin converting factor subunit 1 [Gammaproteobacteria bacterium]MDE0411251.1 molybdopterin converting factor subunit 1 [Gammaproteobacteria bacterium]